LNNKLLEIAKESNAGCGQFYESDWEYNCAAWTGKELEEFADCIVDQCVNTLIEASAEAEASGRKANSRLLLQMAERISVLFAEEETENQ